MKFTRKSVNDALAKAARTETPPVDPVFANQLEKRLKSLDLSMPTVTLARTLRRSVPRGIAIGIVAAGVTGVAAAAMAVVITHNTSENRLIVASTPPAQDASTTAAATSTTIEPTTSTMTVTVSTAAIDAAPTITVAPTMVPPPVAPPVPTTVAATTTTLPATTAPPATTVAPTAPPTTPVPATTAPATQPTAPREPTTTAAPEPTTTSTPSTSSTSTTEVHTPATITLSCVLVTGGVQCSWSGAPPETDHYIVLKSTPGSQGHVLTPAPGATTITDNDVSPGHTYTYLVHAMSAANASIAHSEPNVVNCCL